MSQTNNNPQFQTESYTIVRAPIDQKTGAPFEQCSFALYPGIALAQSEPELVVLMYDSLLHQHPDTGMLLYKGYGSDPLLNRKYQQRLLTRWRSLGKPTVILTSPEDRKFFRGSLGEIPTVSIYEELISRGVSGGCNRELYRLSEPEEYGFEASIRELADMMGVILYDASSNSDIPSSDVSRIPFLTSSMDLRNTLKKRGFEAVHILELVYGMGKSNLHLAHVHSDNHSHDEAPHVRETTRTPEEAAAQEVLFDEDVKKQNLQDLHDTLLSFFWGE